MELVGYAERSAELVDRLRAAGCVSAEEEARLLLAGAETPAELERLVAGRVAGAPLEQVLGWAAFCGRRIGLVEGVFVPRARTALLVCEAAAAVRRTGSTRPVLVDLCCGSGAVAVALLDRVPGLAAYAVDLDPVAVRCARANLAGRATVRRGDLFAPLPARLAGRVTVMTANAPYVPTEALATLPREARLHEPVTALDGGPDGLAVLRRVAADAPHWLAPGGHLVVECARSQTADLVGAVEGRGLEARVAAAPELGAIVVVGRRPGPARPAPGRAPRSRRQAP